MYIAIQGDEDQNLPGGQCWVKVYPDLAAVNKWLAECSAHLDDKFLRYPPSISAHFELADPSFHREEKILLVKAQLVVPRRTALMVTE